MTGTRSLSRMNRNVIERERRAQMKTLFSRLFNLLPPHPTKMSLPTLIEHATLYVKQLQKQMEELKRRKVKLEAENIEPQAVAAETISPVINVMDLDSTVEVNLIAGTDMTFALCDIIRVLEEEGAEVLRATYHTAGNRILLSVHSQAAYSRIGIENSRVHERLNRLQISLKDSLATAAN